jgi:molybdopterin molybdotransferase
VLRALNGNDNIQPAFAAARAAKDIKGKPELTRFVPAYVEPGVPPGKLPEVLPVSWQGSGDLAAFAQANCFAVVPEGTEKIVAGELVHILPI